MTPSLWSRASYVFYRSETVFTDTSKNGKISVINELLFSRKLIGESFKMVPPLDPKIWHGLYFLTFVKNGLIVRAQK